MDIPCLNNGDTCIDPSVPIGNYSSEAPDADLFIGYRPPNDDPYLGTNWTSWGCLGVQCVSEVSQEDADLCAERQAIYCLDDDNPDEDVFLSDPQSASWDCGDGTSFTYSIPAGTFASMADAVAANAAARSYVLNQAKISRVCLSSVDSCCCLDQEYSQRIRVSSGSSIIIWSIVSGSIPEGMTFHGGITTNGSVLIDGTATESGTYNFSVKAETPTGSYSIRPYSIVVLEITTTALPAFNVGTAYSKQLEVEGGSGNYVWGIVAGSLPSGLTLSDSGLISGTPTADDGTANITFSVFDETCEIRNRTNFRPAIELETVSTTYLRTKRGYPEYVLTDGTLYKKITFSGSITQTAISQANQVSAAFQCAGAKYVYSGSSEIDAEGNYITTHRKDLLVPCDLVTTWPSVAEGTNASTALSFPGTYWDESRIHRMLGYCFVNDYGNSPCASCNFDASGWVPYGNYQTPSPLDAPANMLTDPAGFTTTATTFAYNGTASGDFLTDANLQILTLDPANPVNISATGSYSAVLSEPYTEAEAMATQRTVVANGAVAESLPDYLRVPGAGFLTYIYSRETSVAFTLNLTNLLVGENYVVSYELSDSNGSITTISELVTATEEEQQILGTIPVPSSGHRITIRKPTISYV